MAHWDNGEGQLNALQDIEPLVEVVQLVGDLADGGHQQGGREGH